MKYKINQKVICGKLKCLVIATKKESYKPNLDIYNRKEVFPKKDYLLSILRNIDTLEYSGILDVNEIEIEDVDW